MTGECLGGPGDPRGRPSAGPKLWAVRLGKVCSWLTASRCASSQIGEKIAGFQMRRKAETEPNQTEFVWLSQSDFLFLFPFSIPQIWG